MIYGMQARDEWSGIIVPGFFSMVPVSGHGAY